MKYDQGEEPVKIVHVFSGALKTSTPEDYKPIHELHQDGNMAVLGRGRFSKRDKTFQLLWQASNMAMTLQMRLQATDASHEMKQLPVQSTDTSTPAMWISGRPNEFQSQSIACIMDFVKGDRLMLNLLGLTRQDLARWSGNWTQMPSADAILVEKLANHLFGDVLHTYTEMQIVSIVVKFYTTSPTHSPVLIRISIGQDPRQDVQTCSHCDATFQTVDYIGSQGATTLHISSLDTMPEMQFKSLSEFENHHRVKSRTAHTKWSQLAYLHKGWRLAPLLRICHCDEKIHTRSGNEHYIDVWDEKHCEQEKFEPDVQTQNEELFDPFPQDPTSVLLVGDHLPPEDSDEERWDPEGEEDLDDEFEPFPPDEHSETFLSPAVWLQH
jgi:hypothetical protein